LSRVINPDGPGKDRAHLSRSIVIAIRELAQQEKPDDKSRDMAAFISLALAAIYTTVDDTVVAWEKRGYWVKADKFRMEWAWSGQLAEKMKQSVLADDWIAVAQIAAQTAIKLNKVNVPVRNSKKQPWLGAREMLMKG
jgi:hypothetical protein